MEKNRFGKAHRLGILGGGQLGRMFIQEAINYGIDVYIMENDVAAPSAEICTAFTKGDITNFDDVMAFGASMDVVTVEIENVNIEALYELEKKGVEVYPQPRVLEIIKDKGIQKQFYVDHQIPTSPFTFIDEPQSADLHSKLPFVMKLRTGGYDGRGVQVMRSEDDLQKSFEAPSIAEEFVPFEKELSVIVARNKSGEVAVYPTVECEFNDANLVAYLFSPADVSKDVERRAKEIAMDVINKLDMVGILAVELFLKSDGEILVNEIAPRPHNSGHHTIECNITSQFEQHLRSILDFPLGSTDMTRNGAMLNILGSNGHKGPAIYQGIEESIKLPGVHIHLYGKENTKPNRKMGHVTVAGAEMTDVKRIAAKLKDRIQVITG